MLPYSAHSTNSSQAPDAAVEIRNDFDRAVVVRAREEVGERAEARVAERVERVVVAIEAPAIAADADLRAECAGVPRQLPVDLVGRPLSRQYQLVPAAMMPASSSAIRRWRRAGRTVLASVLSIALVSCAAERSESDSVTVAGSAWTREVETARVSAVRSDALVAVVFMSPRCGERA